MHRGCNQGSVVSQSSLRKCKATTRCSGSTFGPVHLWIYIYIYIYTYTYLRAGRLRFQCQSVVVAEVQQASRSFLWLGSIRTRFDWSRIAGTIEVGACAFSAGGKFCCLHRQVVHVLCAGWIVSRLDVAAGWRLLSCQGTREGRAEEEFMHCLARRLAHAEVDNPLPPPVVKASVHDKEGSPPAIAQF